MSAPGTKHGGRNEARLHSTQARPLIYVNSIGYNERQNDSPRLQSDNMPIGTEDPQATLFFSMGIALPRKARKYLAVSRPPK
jgi:hypothetical protein